MKSSEMAEVAEGLDIAALISKSIHKAEKESGLSEVLLKREPFAKQATSTGILWLDYIMGGGIPAARVIGIAGPEHAGKSVLVTNILDNQCKRGGVSTFLDAEGSTDPVFLSARGIDFNRYRGRRNKNGELLPKQKDYFHLYQPRTGEEFTKFVITVMQALPENKNPDKPQVIYALDSVIALISDALDENIEANKMAMHARMYAQLMPIINGHLVKTGCSLVYTNQLRQKPGVVYGSNLYEPGGDALKFFSSIRLILKSTKAKLLGDDHPLMIKDSPYVPGLDVKAGGVWIEPCYDSEGKIIGEDKYIVTAITTEKNKMYSPFKTCWMRIQFESNGSTGCGVDPVFDIFSFFFEIGCMDYAAPGEGEKKGDVKGFFETKPIEGFNPHDFGFAKRFTYPEFKQFVIGKPGLVETLRSALIESSIAYQ